MAEGLPELLRVARRIQRALVDAAECAYEDAGIRGLCAEGRWEAAVQAMRAVDVGWVARATAASAESPGPGAGSGSAESDARSG